MKRLASFIAGMITCIILVTGSYVYAIGGIELTPQVTVNKDVILQEMALNPLFGGKYLDIAVANHTHITTMASIVKTALDRTEDGSTLVLTNEEQKQFEYNMNSIRK